MEWQRKQPNVPGWYWLQTSSGVEVVKVFEYRVEPGAPLELEVAQARHQFTAPISDERFASALWAGPIDMPKPMETLTPRRRVGRQALNQGE